MVRYNTNGGLDEGFGIKGKVITEKFYDTITATSIAIQSDGKIVMAGFNANSAGYNFVAVRYEGGGVSTLAPIYYLLQ